MNHYAVDYCVFAACSFSFGGHYETLHGGKSRQKELVQGGQRHNGAVTDNGTQYLSS